MPRKLRVLVIDDVPEQATQLGSPWLEIMPVPAYDAEEDEEPDLALSSWTQHLWLWANNAFPEPDADLILVDCRFEEDMSSPPLERQGDPRGLLHGALYVARLFGKDRHLPFGFAGYSQDASGFRSNPFAQTFMGFLLAMRESTLPEGSQGILRGRDEFELVQACSDVLGATINQYPTTAWSPALQMYRERLAETLSTGVYLVDRNAWTEAMGLLKAGDSQALSSTASLSWRTSSGEMDSVYLASIFADALEFGRWTGRTTEMAQRWLDGFPVVGDVHSAALEWADAANDPEQLGAIDIEIPKGKGRHGETFTTFFHACAATVAWMRNRSEDPAPLPSGVLVREVALSPKQVDRYFKKILDLNWGQVVARLDEGREAMVWPFPELWELRAVLEDWAAVRKIEFPFQ